VVASPVFLLSFFGLGFIPACTLFMYVCMCMLYVHVVFFLDHHHHPSIIQFALPPAILPSFFLFFSLFVFSNPNFPFTPTMFHGSLLFLHHSWHSLSSIINHRKVYICTSVYAPIVALVVPIKTIPAASVSECLDRGSLVTQSDALTNQEARTN